ncbi:MAG TPA: hypothetical protein PKB02_04600 [Anaerohalosphaeraceae bacterium]|nr:hypothetical protein [Anaerohalosphaeraceae bacterium]
MRPKMKMWISIALIWLCLCVVGGGYLLIKLPGIVIDVLTRYYESDPQKMMVYLNDRYGLAFPKSTIPIKAATATTDASGNSSFIIKFQINYEDVNGFLANFEQSIDELAIYSPAADCRSQNNFPDWFKTPIQSGRIGYLRKKAKNIKLIAFGFVLYVDLSKDDTVVVYMEGTYTSEEDYLNNSQRNASIQREASKQNAPASVKFSIGDKEYFEIPDNIIVIYTIRDGETLFRPSDTQQGSVSITDKYCLTATVVHCLNKNILQGKRITSDPSLTVDMLNGPFYLEINDTDHCIELKIDNYVCSRIDYTLLSGHSLSSILQERGIDKIILKDNTLDHSDIGGIDEACVYPLNFKQDPLDVSEQPLVSIIPRKIPVEALFLKAKQSECVLEVANSDYALLVSTLRGYSSYIRKK